VLTRRAAVCGKPITHSLSPVLHNAGYLAAGLDGWAYTSVECAEAELADLVTALGPEWAGLSLTMPLKEAALVVADEVGPLAAAIGAANTLVRTAEGWRAENTDAPGMVDALRESGVESVDTVAILGAGGTARAAVAAAQTLRAREIRVYANRAAAALELAVSVGGLGATIAYGPWEEIETCAEADLVISTVPRGVVDDLRPAWRAGTVLFDVVYDPWPTPVAAAAERAGCAIVSGLDLLLHQAGRQFTLFTGVRAPLSAMRSALSQAAARRA
jgi:shikimate-5-dehydrogenase